MPPPPIPPPKLSLLSKTTTLKPLLAKYLAAVIPEGPAPTITTSVLAISAQSLQECCTMILVISSSGKLFTIISASSQGPTYGCLVVKRA
jgi:hypothetical protein